jgi:hypothetical protein
MRVQRTFSQPGYSPGSVSHYHGRQGSRARPSAALRILLRKG